MYSIRQPIEDASSFLDDVVENQLRRTNALAYRSVPVDLTRLRAVFWQSKPIRDTDPIYHGYRFPPEIISHAVWLYYRFALSLRDVEDLLAERGITVSSSL